MHNPRIARAVLLLSFAARYAHHAGAIIKTPATTPHGKTTQRDDELTVPAGTIGGFAVPATAIVTFEDPNPNPRNRLQFEYRRSTLFSDVLSSDHHHWLTGTSSLRVNGHFVSTVITATFPRLDPIHSSRSKLNFPSPVVTVPTVER